MPPVCRVLRGTPLSFRLLNVRLSLNTNIFKVSQTKRLIGAVQLFQMAVYWHTFSITVVGTLVQGGSGGTGKGSVVAPPRG